MRSSVISLTFTAVFSIIFLLGAAGAIASHGEPYFAVSLVLGAVGAPISATVSAFRAPLKA